jgi:hypothetical protein
VRKTVELNFSLADGSITDINRSDEQLFVEVQTWNDRKIVIQFGGVIGYRESLANDISELVVSEGAGWLWEWSISRAYTPPIPRGEKCYQFLDNDNDVSLEIVATTVTTHMAE